jgi:hypothetical protein
MASQLRGLSVATALSATLAIIVGSSVLAGGGTGKNGHAIVALLEPSLERPGSVYTVTIEGKRYESVGALMDALRETNGSEMILLVREDVRVGQIVEVVSIATKAGIQAETIALFVFDRERRAVQSIPGYRHAGYTLDPRVLHNVVSETR